MLLVPFITYLQPQGILRYVYYAEEYPEGIGYRVSCFSDAEITLMLERLRLDVF